MKSSPLKPSTKRMKSHRKSPRPGNRAMTKSEAAHVDRIKRSGCGCCIQRGYLPPDDGSEPPAVEAHHHLENGIRIGHLATEGMCIWHHRDRLYVEGWDRAMHRLRLGPNLEKEPAAFERAFGTDAERLRMQAERLGGVA